MQIGCGPRDQAATTRNAKIPVEVSYPIIRDEEAFNAFKRLVDVRLNMKVPPEVLREIALDVKSSEKKQYERTFIFVYLPEQIPGVKNEPWATCSFNPTLDVEILGLTKEEEAALRNMKLDIPGRKIGAWLIDRHFTSRVAVLYEEGDRVKLAELVTGGGRFDSEMTELPSETGRRFRDSRFKGGDIYAVDDSGILRIYNGDGKAFTGALPLK
jgi:hypothetical protein